MSTPPGFAAPGGDTAQALTRRVISGYDGPTTLTELVQLASILARSRGGMVPPVYFNNPDAIIAVSFAARALDIPMWVALHELYTVKGVVGKKAVLIRALWLRHGITYDFDVTDTECTGWIRRPGEDRKYEVTYSILDAQRLGLVDRNEEWKKQPKAMLVARWTTTTANRWTPHIILGMDTEDLSTDPAGEETAGWHTGEEIGPEVLRVLEEAGLAVQKGQGVEGLRGIWDRNLVLLDAWAGEGESLRQVLTRMITEEAVKGLPGEPRQHPGDLALKRLEPVVVQGTVTARQDHGVPQGADGTLWGPEEAAVADMVRAAAQGKAAGPEGTPATVAGDLPCGCPLADVMAGTGHRETCVLNGTRS
ncbi:hypothetical protein [Streptomyces yaizuensis]|uniref:Uncharacterized protein n=1 Tax=Streptomyces yaizuensis TaxID=2989713 RepID=A0AA86JBN3_9ACTN|nr:hypothetical protein [Streptomyces sp. YSPA8]BDT39573.1 hypothetical protein SYYSPA8_37275 [Streptomyces sp. YSPA8]